MQILDIQEAIDELNKPMTICDLNSVIKYLGQLEEEHYDQLREVEERDCDNCYTLENDNSDLQVEINTKDDLIKSLEFDNDQLQRDIENYIDQIDDLKKEIVTLEEQ